MNTRPGNKRANSTAPLAIEVLTATQALEVGMTRIAKHAQRTPPAWQRAPNIRFWNAAAPERFTIGGVPNGGSARKSGAGLITEVTLSLGGHAAGTPNGGGSARCRPLERPHADQPVLSAVGLASPSAAQIAIPNIPPGWYTGPPAGGVTGVGW
jgi:hypothetical protein